LILAEAGGNIRQATDVVITRSRGDVTYDSDANQEGASQQPETGGIA
jgi:hypothetical protein